MHTHEIVSAIISRADDGPGVRPLARALGITETSAYRMGREPLSDEDPEKTGAFNFLDRFEAVVRMLASYPKARWILLRLEAWTRVLFDQVLHRDEGATCDTALLQHLAQLAREHGETMAKCLNGDQDFDGALREAYEDRDVLNQVIRILEACADHTDISPAMKRVS